MQRLEEEPYRTLGRACYVLQQTNPLTVHITAFMRLVQIV